MSTCSIVQHKEGDMAVYSLDELIEIFIQWEEDLTKFYKILSGHLKDDEALNVVRVLARDQDKILAAVKSINLDDAESFEYNKSLPNFRSTHLLSDVEVSDSSSALDILEKVMDYEEQLLELYRHLAEFVTYEQSRELMTMLRDMKLGQIKKIKSCMDSYT